MCLYISKNNGTFAQIIDKIEDGTETYNAPFYYVFRTANSYKNN